MRILHVTDTYLPVVGGIEQMVHQLATRQSAAGHEVTVVTRAPGECADTPFSVVRSGHVPPSLVRTTDQLHAHVSVWSPLAGAGLRAAARAGVPALATVHSSWRGLEPVVRTLAVTGGWADPRVQWAAVSQCAAEPVRRTLHPDGGVLIVPNAVDADLWRPGPRDLHPGELVVVSTLRMARRKRPLHLVDLLAEAADRMPPGIRLRAVLVGDGPLLERVRARAHRRDLNLTLPGRLDHPGLRKVLATADVYVAPADLETFGLAALEARCAGLVVLGKRHTGVADLVEDGVTGLLADDDQGLTRHLIELAGDPWRLTQMRHQVRTTPARFDWDSVLTRHEDAYALSAERAGAPAHTPALARRYA